MGGADLAGSVLTRVKAPTLLIVGGNDFSVIAINRDALDKLHVEKKLVVIPGATYLFEKSGTLGEVAQLTASWFSSHLSREVAGRRLR